MVTPDPIDALVADLRASSARLVAMSKESTRLALIPATGHRLEAIERRGHEYGAICSCGKRSVSPDLVEALLGLARHAPILIPQSNGD